MMKFQILATTLLFSLSSISQLMLPNSGANLHNTAGRRVGLTDIEVSWNAPGVKGREGKIWGTDVAPYGFVVLGFGSKVQSPWRAGADESTTISFSTDVTINGKALPAGNYGFFIALYPDSCVLIFNRNTKGWGSYFYSANLDVLRVSAVQQKNQPQMVERLQYSFANQTAGSVELALEWERWRIPFTVAIDLKKTVLQSIQQQMSGAMGFDPPSLQQAAAWCLTNGVNYTQALQWITSATDPALGGVQSFAALSTRAGLLRQLGQPTEANAMMNDAIDKASANELHQYGRQLLAENKPAEAMVIFEKNFTKQKGAWPTHVGMMRGYSAIGKLDKALEHARLALAQAPDDINRSNLKKAIETLNSGKPL
jgi:tetratricopeptide (TPR) repeat protein